MSWHKNDDLAWEDITKFIDSACFVIATVEPIDYKGMGLDENIKREMIESATAVICKGLNSILLIEQEVKQRKQQEKN